MNIVKMPIETLTAAAAAYHPRQDLIEIDPEYQTIERSIDDHGLVLPLVFNSRTSTLVSGHQRIKILLKRGITEVEVSVVDLPLEREVALNLALNKVSGRWDQEKLAQLLHDYSSNPDFNLDSTGFFKPEVDQLFDRYLVERNGDDFDVEQEAQKIAEPVTQLGDLIELGAHKILCADARNSDEIMRLMGGSFAHMAFTDPPYRVKYLSSNRPVNTGKSRWQPILNDDLSEEAYEKLLSESLSNMGAILKAGSPFYVWNGYAQFSLMHRILDSLGMHVACVIVWLKPNGSPSYADYSWACEFGIYGWTKGGSHRWYGPNNETNVWECGRDSARELQHPSQKPVALAMKALQNSSQRGEIVIDFFLGSASTLIAAEKMSRICYGVELSPMYVDIAVKRYAKTFGVKSISDKVRKKYGL